MFRTFAIFFPIAALLGLATSLHFETKYILACGEAANKGYDLDGCKAGHDDTKALKSASKAATPVPQKGEPTFLDCHSTSSKHPGYPRVEWARMYAVYLSDLRGDLKTVANNDNSPLSVIHSQIDLRNKGGKEHIIGFFIPTDTETEKGILKEASEAKP